MTLKTNGGKAFYWTTTIIAIITTLILLIIYTADNSSRSIVFAADDNEVYLVKIRGCCGKCSNDYWDFYDDNGESIRVFAPLLKQYNFIQVYFNQNKFDEKSKIFSLGSYKEVYQKVLNEDGFYLKKVKYYHKVYQDQTYTFKKIIYLLFLFWIIISSLLIALPLINIRPSKKFFTELMKYASYVEEDDKISFYHNDGKLQVTLRVTSKEVCFSEVYYKEDRVAHDVYVLSDGTLKNICTREYYWIKRATKSILPAFKNKMINTKLEHIF